MARLSSFFGTEGPVHTLSRVTTHPAWPVYRQSIDSESLTSARAPWRLSSVLLPALLLADVTLTAVLLGGQTWWLAAATWVVSLVLLLRGRRPRLV